MEKNIYESMIKDIDVWNKKTTINLNMDFIALIKNDPIKFISGTLIWGIVFIVLLIKKEKIFLKIGSLITVIVIGGLLGFFGMLIPIIITPIINYIFYPIIQLIFIYSLITKNETAQTQRTTAS